MAYGKKLSDLTADETERIILDNYEEIYRYCWWKVKNRDDAEDLTQETFLRFVQMLSDYSEQGKPRALLYTIARNLCINHYRRVKPLSLSEAEILPSVDPKLQQIDGRISLQAAIEQLPYEQQEVILFRYGQDLQVNEIAKIMGLSRFAVMYRIRTALHSLKKNLEKEEAFFEK